MPVDRFGDTLPVGAVARLGSARYPIPAPNTAMAFAPDGRSFAAAGKDATLRLWEPKTSKDINQFAIHEGAVTALVFSPNGKEVATGGGDGRINFWDTTTGSELRQSEGHQGAVFAMTYSADGETLLTAGADCIRLWEPQSLAELGQFEENFGAFDALAFAPEVTTLALGSWESAIRICDIADGTEIWRFLGARGGVKTMSFAPDAKCLATGSTDGSVRIWELATGKQRRQFPNHIDGTYCVQFSPDGTLLASSGADTTILLWQVHTHPEVTPESIPQDIRLLEPLWNTLAEADPVKAHKAICGLSLSKHAVPFLVERLKKVCPVPRQQTVRRIAELHDGQMVVRERATEYLQEYGALIEPYLREAQAAGPPLEARRRLDRLLAKIAGREHSPLALQAFRAIEIMENLGSTEARLALATLGRSQPEGWLSQEAAAAAQRMAERRT